MHITDTKLAGVKLIYTDKFSDNRGWFRESFNLKNIENLLRGNGTSFNSDSCWVQDNESFSKQGVFRGLHYQLKNPQAKIVSCRQGKIKDVIADIRTGSPTFGQHITVEMNENDFLVYIPQGYAHGFYAVSDAIVSYKVNQYYTKGDEYGIKWDDPTLNIKLDENKISPILSEKDCRNMSLEEAAHNNLLPIFREIK